MKAIRSPRLTTGNAKIRDKTKRRTRNSNKVKEIREEDPKEITWKKGEVWEVEKVVGEKFEKNKLFFEVKWKGWDSKYNTWEPEDNLNCAHLIERFRQITARSPSPSPSRSASPSSKKSNSNNNSNRSTRSRSATRKSQNKQANKKAKANSQKSKVKSSSSSSTRSNASRKGRKNKTSNVAKILVLSDDNNSKLEQDFNDMMQTTNVSDLDRSSSPKARSKRRIAVRSSPANTITTSTSNSTLRRSPRKRSSTVAYSVAGKNEIVELRRSPRKVTKTTTTTATTTTKSTPTKPTTRKRGRPTKNTNNTSAPAKARKRRKINKKNKFLEYNDDNDGPTIAELYDKIINLEKIVQDKIIDVDFSDAEEDEKSFSDSDIDEIRQNFSANEEGNDADDEENDSDNAIQLTDTFSVTDTARFNHDLVRIKRALEQDEVTRKSKKLSNASLLDYKYSWEVSEITPNIFRVIGSATLNDDEDIGFVEATMLIREQGDCSSLYKDVARSNKLREVAVNIFDSNGKVLQEEGLPTIFGDEINDGHILFIDNVFARKCNNRKELMTQLVRGVVHKATEHINKDENEEQEETANDEEADLMQLEQDTEDKEQADADSQSTSAEQTNESQESAESQRSTESNTTENQEATATATTTATAIATEVATEKTIVVTTDTATISVQKTVLEATTSEQALDKSVADGDNANADNANAENANAETDTELEKSSESIVACDTTSNEAAIADATSSTEKSEVEAPTEDKEDLSANNKENEEAALENVESTESFAATTTTTTITATNNDKQKESMDVDTENEDDNDNEKETDSFRFSGSNTDYKLIVITRIGHDTSDNDREEKLRIFKQNGFQRFYNSKFLIMNFSDPNHQCWATANNTTADFAFAFDKLGRDYCKQLSDTQLLLWYYAKIGKFDLFNTLCRDSSCSSISPATASFILNTAIESGNYNIVNYVLSLDGCIADFRVDVNATDPRGFTPLLATAYSLQYDKSCDFTIAKTISSSTDRNHPTTSSILSTATCLLDKGALCCIKNIDHKSALYYIRRFYRLAQRIALLNNADATTVNRTTSSNNNNNNNSNKNDSINVLDTITDTQYRVLLQLIEAHDTFTWDFEKHVGLPLCFKKQVQAILFSLNFLNVGNLPAKALHIICSSLFLSDQY